jgi:hypothetical protein
VPAFIDSGEQAVRWVIVDDTGIKLFSDKDNRALVFSSKDDAFATTTLDLFAEQEPGDINVAAVGETKFKVLQEKIPFVEVDASQAEALIRERIELLSAVAADEASTPEEL